MGLVRIPISEVAVNTLKKLPRQKQSAIKKRISSMLEDEIKNVSVFDMNDYQEVMGMSDSEMILTFGKEYLTEKNWKGCVS